MWCWSPQTPRDDEKQSNVNTASEAVKRMGLALEDDDLALLVRGSPVLKASSTGRRGRRVMSLRDDCSAVRCSSRKLSKLRKRRTIFSISDLVEVREGCQTETLRALPFGSGGAPETGGGNRNGNNSGGDGAGSGGDGGRQPAAVPGHVDPQRCFTLVFRGRQANLDLVADNAEDARRWVYCLRSLSEHSRTMDARQKLDTYPGARSDAGASLTATGHQGGPVGNSRLSCQRRENIVMLVFSELCLPCLPLHPMSPAVVLLNLPFTWLYRSFRKADKNKDNRMTFDEVKDLLNTLNVSMNEVEAKKLFDESDSSHTGDLVEDEFVQLFRKLTRRDDVATLFKRLSPDGIGLPAARLAQFLQDEQHEDDSEHRAACIIAEHEPLDEGRSKGLMTLDGFVRYLTSPDGSLWDQRHDSVSHDMTQPLSHYFISSSHNTYLTDDQLRGPSSTEAYVKSLMRGCRCVELDCWDGADGEPVIYHGYTLTSQILFRDVITSIAHEAFKASAYPVILSLENHCNVEQQIVMARHLRSILGERLVTAPLPGRPPTQLPSPEELKGKFLIKAKKRSKPVKSEAEGNGSGVQSDSTGATTAPSELTGRDSTADKLCTGIEDARSEPKPEPQHTNNQPETQAGAHSEPQPELKSETRLESQPQPEIRPETHLQTEANPSSMCAKDESRPSDAAVLNEEEGDIPFIDGDNEVTDGIADGVTGGVTDRVTNEVKDRVATEVAVEVVDEVTDGVKGKQSETKGIGLRRSLLMKVDSFTRHSSGSGSIKSSAKGLGQASDTESDVFEDSKPSTGKHKPLKAEKSKKKEVSKELSDCVIYCSGVHFEGLERAESHQKGNEMCSFSETKTMGLIETQGNAFVRYNMQHLSRTYPSGTRVGSGNYNPHDMWNAGCQIVALNFQTPGKEMDLYDGLFRQNGGCGYVLKPSFLRDPHTDFDPGNPARGTGRHPVKLAITVISGQQLPKERNSRRGSIIDPLVSVEVHGVRGDTAVRETHHQENNGLNPVWKEEFLFQLTVPELALIRFVVKDYDVTSRNDFIGQFSLPFSCLRQGYRHVHLLSLDGRSLFPATLFVHIRITELKEIEGLDRGL
ncbi:1-phosphatidylinositol 4,5-bisphosphate phosphodiesterase delta-4-like [Petromyzon marinus]|uniref:1-phosphatidylinositol 4,5-bisphosphate phosphodiesterase delta-4-like n=1 Tax=Petromyzon marinus TaxID=7757 RepID=UPI003F6FD4F3